MDGDDAGSPGQPPGASDPTTGSPSGPFSVSSASRRRSVASSRLRLVGLGVVALSCAPLVACGSAGSSAPPSSSASAVTCQRITAVLSDGPDPDADPVGYAFAQILPLQQIKSPSDAALQGAIDDLASAYQDFYQSNGASPSAKNAVNQASEKLDTLCPGAGAGS
jgi:hypothetical protein